MAKNQNLQEGTIVAGRYRVERPLGEGGMSTVYAVRHVHTGELLAMKILRAAATSDLRAVELFRREMRAPARIESEHVVRVTDADVAPEMGNAPFMVMELLRGHDLERVLLKQRALPAPEVLLYLTQAARALDKAHRLGIVHRDLKPENLFLTRREDGTPWIKILDFGIAKIDPSATEGIGAIATTAAGEVFGTPLYMAPEQAQGQNDRVGPWTDIWALGVIAHKLLTGKDAWQPRNLAHLVSLVAYEPIATPSSRGFDLGAGFDAWFLRCCSREPEDRFPTAGEAVAALSDALGVKPADPVFLAREEPAGSRTSDVGNSRSSDVGNSRSSDVGNSRSSDVGKAREEVSSSLPDPVPREVRPSSAPLSRTGLDLQTRRSGWLVGVLIAAALGVGGLLIALQAGVADRPPLTPALSGVRAVAAAQASAAQASAAPAAGSSAAPRSARPAPGTPGGVTRPATTAPFPAGTGKRPPVRKSGDPMLDIRD